MIATRSCPRWRKVESAAEKSVWNEREGSSQLSSATASFLAECFEEEPPRAFTQSMARKDFGPYMSGSVMRDAIPPSEGNRLKAELISFLKGGAFSWRFVEL
jgi:hypothetical protein